jgi:predicted transcriptional regulator
MYLREIAEKLSLEAVCCEGELDRDVSGGYATDLMSDAIAHAEADSVWVTLQTHANVVAIAVMKGLAAVILTGGRRPDPDAAAKAETEGVPVLSTPWDSYEMVGRLWEIGVKRESHGSAAG